MRIALLTADVGNSMPNVGDFFITRSIEQMLSRHELFRVPMHEAPTSERLNSLRASDALVVCGSNIVGAGGTIRMAYRPEHFSFIGRPTIPLGLGSQADLGRLVTLDDSGRDLLRCWFESSGVISVRDTLTLEIVNRVLGERASRLTGCPSLSLKVSTLSSPERRGIYCPGPFHFRSTELDRKRYLRVSHELYARSVKEAPTLFLAQQPSDFEFEPAPSTHSFHSANAPAFHLRAIASASFVLSFRIHPCLVAVSHGIPSFLVALDERTKSLAQSLGIPFCEFKETPSSEAIWEKFQCALFDYPWVRIDENRGQLVAQMQHHLEEKGLLRSPSSVRAVNTNRKILRIACIGDAIFLPSLLGLVQNLLDLHSGPIECHCLALDAEVKTRLETQYPLVRFHFYTLQDLWTPWELERITVRSTAEKAYTSKPRLLKRVLGFCQARVLFVDADVYFYSSPDEWCDGLENHSVLLFPHHHDQEKNVMEHGIFNTGLLGVAPGADAFLDWWSTLCLHRCDAKGPTFYEQGFLDTAPSKFDSVGIYPGDQHNAGPWNVNTLGTHLSRYEPWVMQNGRSQRILSYHAAEHDRQGLFETKFCWDQLVTFFSPLRRLDDNALLFQNVCLQQRNYWRALSRAVFLFETLHYRWGLSWAKLSPHWVRFLVSGWGRRPSAGIARIYGWARASRRKLARSRRSFLELSPSQP